MHCKTQWHLYVLHLEHLRFATKCFHMTKREQIMFLNSINRWILPTDTDAVLHKLGDEVLLLTNTLVT